MRALVVDDDALNRELAERMLSSMGWSVDQALDGVAALEASTLTDYDLVLLDLRMPRMGGRAAALAIRESYRRRGRPVSIVASTGSDEFEDAMEGVFDAVLLKPFVKAELVAILDGFDATGG